MEGIKERVKVEYKSRDIKLRPIMDCNYAGGVNNKMKGCWEAEYKEMIEEDRSHRITYLQKAIPNLRQTIRNIEASEDFENKLRLLENYKRKLQQHIEDAKEYPEIYDKGV